MTCRTTQIPGGFIITCSREKPKRCKFCGANATKLCDFPLSGAKKGATCSAPMCKACSTVWLQFGDACPPHSRLMVERTEAKRHAREWLEEQKAVDGFAETVTEDDPWFQRAPVPSYGQKPLVREAIPQGGRFEQASRRAREADAARGRASIAQKVEYVKAQPQTRAHHCHWPGCDEQVPPAKWGCREHWYKIPKHLRDAIWAAYNPGQERAGVLVDGVEAVRPSRTYVEVAREVQRWIEEYEKRELDVVDRRAIGDLFADWEAVPDRNEPKPVVGFIEIDAVALGLRLHDQSRTIQRGRDGNWYTYEDESCSRLVGPFDRQGAEARYRQICTNLTDDPDEGW